MRQNFTEKIIQREKKVVKKGERGKKEEVKEKRQGPKFLTPRGQTSSLLRGVRNSG